MQKKLNMYVKQVNKKTVISLNNLHSLAISMLFTGSENDFWIQFSYFDEKQTEQIILVLIAYNTIQTNL